MYDLAEAEEATSQGDMRAIVLAYMIDLGLWFFGVKVPTGRSLR
jgi:hypothetical protein